MIDTRIQRYFLLGQIALVSATSYMAADAVDETIRDRISGGYTIPEVHGMMVRPRTSLPTPEDIASIARGNLFDPSRRGGRVSFPGDLDLGAGPSSGSRNSPGSVVAVGSWKNQKNLPVLRSDSLKLRLVGTLMGSGTLSGAVLEDTAKKTQKFYHVNDTVIPGRVSLAHVQKTSVILKVGDSFGILKARFTAEDDGGQAVSAAGNASPHGIRQLDANHWLVEARAVHAAVRNLNQLMMQARAVPNMVGGKPDGFRIVEIQPGSLYQEVGLLPGDVIESINGMSMSDPQNFMKALSTLGTANEVSIDLVRNGAPQTFSYQVQ
ncbi:MAG: general secretion pathway protein GspC [Nitrospirae bacterium]|nr:general secretion pathway protein GspC [Nitrospirota bacterium]MCL5284169.1 general secretion pathway protein GspC [Nitrospirota bacterium]